MAKTSFSTSVLGIIITLIAVSRLLKYILGYIALSNNPIMLRGQWEASLWGNDSSNEPIPCAHCIGLCCFHDIRQSESGLSYFMLFRFWVQRTHSVETQGVPSVQRDSENNFSGRDEIPIIDNQTVDKEEGNALVYETQFYIFWCCKLALICFKYLLTN